MVSLETMSMPPSAAHDSAAATEDPGTLRVLITGGGSGQGLAIANRFLARGASVMISGHENDVLQQAARALRMAHPAGKCETLEADLADAQQPAAMVSACVDALGGLDCLVNNAGVWQTGSWEEMTPQTWDRSMNIMARAPMLAIQAAVPFLAQRRGRVINNTSTSAVASEPGSALYSAAKAALKSLTESAAVDLASKGIRVNALGPGWVRSAMSEGYLSKLDAHGTAQLNPVGRAAEPDEIAVVAEFLAFDAPDFLTGHTIFVDGGQNIFLAQPEPS